MGLFDGLVAELGQKFGLGDRAGPLVSAFLGLINDPQRGGLSGFLDRFRQAGLGDQVASWVGRGTNATLSPEQLERGMGREALDRVASSANVSTGVASGALAYLVPKVVDFLTPDGTVPAGLPAGLGAAAGGLGAAVGGLGTAAGARAREAFGTTGAAAVSGGSTLRKLVPVLLLLLLAFLAYRFFTRDRSAAPVAGTTADSIAPPVAAAPEDATEPLPPGSAEETGAAGDPDAAVRAATRKTAEALAGLRPGYSAEDLVSALNLNIIKFASGSAEIPAASRDILNQSAKAIAGAPEGTVLEVGGHTDSVGNAAANQRLSGRRAEAVRKYLVDQGAPAASLQAKGYGASNPVADNGTEEGRFRNRRIEFRVLK